MGSTKCYSPGCPSLEKGPGWVRMQQDYTALEEGVSHPLSSNHQSVLSPCGGCLLRMCSLVWKIPPREGSSSLPGISPFKLSLQAPHLAPGEGTSGAQGRQD